MNRTKLDTINEFKFRKSSSLFTSDSWIYFCLIISWIKFENSRIINIIIFIDDHVWCAIENKTKSFEHEIFFTVKNSNSQFFFWLEIHSNTNYLLFVWLETHSNTKYLFFVLIWLQHFCLIASKWLEKSL